ncbi:MAG: hypothetical protein MR324_11195 [Lachnospiraceae bacterium]|nr:hypothetical protein [Lachnospiraceae bacterium]
MKKIIDLSKNNAVTDWSKVKSAVDGVIIRCGFRGWGSGKITADKKASEFALKCDAYGIPFGVYFMSQAITPAEGREEADYACDFADKYGALLPIFIDSEDGDGTSRIVRADGLTKDKRTDIAKAFCDRVQERGRKSGVYASESWFGSNLNYNALTQYIIWCAKYGANTGSKCTSVKLSKCDMHQYTSRGQISGIKGNVDISECYFLDTGNTENNAHAHIQPNYKAGQDYFVHVNGLRIRSAPSTSGKIIGSVSNRAVKNRATTRDSKGQIWMDISGTSKQEWICADTGKKSFVY